jgi:thiosulfate/3-mercaptopyruvate sulfurtransferase
MRRLWAAGAAVLLSMAVGALPALSAESSTPASVEIPAEYAHPEALVDADWLAEHLDDPTVRIVDARMPFEASLYQAAHIPGAVFVNVSSELCCPSEIMPADEFASLMGQLGIGDDTIVVVYDTEGGRWSARLWWALRYYGHDDVAMLDGGLRSWVGSGGAIETEAPDVEPAVFTPEVQPRWRATIDEVKGAIDDPAVSLVDGLPRSSYTGDWPDFGGGHIPSAVSLPAPDTLNEVFLTVHSPEVLSRMLMRLGLDPAQRVITYCGGGPYGSHDAFVLYLMGFDDVALYDGCMMEWTSDPSNPVDAVP